MKLQFIKTASAYEAKVNFRGKNFEGPAFDDLVLSVKEKGILVPVLVRPKKSGQKLFEVVAGNRRFRAAVLAGLKQVPAQVREMSDTEAAEAQIIENLQRQDIHPYDEGMACRSLIENTKGYDITAVAAKLGKSEKYVRQRILLTNLTDKAVKALQEDKIKVSHAILIARLEPKEQKDAINYVLEDCYEVPDVSDLREWIQEHSFSQIMKNQPWKNDEELAAAVGPCKECPQGADLFGEKAEGECSDPTCYSRKMAAYIELKKKEFKDKKIPLTLVSMDYSTDLKKVKGRGEYKELDGKDHCDSEHQALVVEGRSLGKVIRICTDQKCKKHSHSLSSGGYRLSPEEKAKRKKEQEAQQAKEDREYQEVHDAALKISWPFEEKALDILFEIVMARVGQDAMRPFVKRKGWEVERKVDKYSWGGDRKYLDYEGACIREAKKMTAEEKKTLVMELLLLHTYGDRRKKIIKLI